MSALHALFHLARADLRERRRRDSFLLLLGATVILGYLFVPPPDAPYLTLALGYARGIYSSAWVGAMFGLVITTMVSLFAFYPIKNAVARDRETQVGQIIAATPLRKPIYTLGKWLSNVSLLTILLAVMTGMAVIMQLVRAEDTRVDLAALVIPMWLVAFPALSLVGALAVLFECTPVLRGGVGNVLYFFLVIGVLVLSIGLGGGMVVPGNDPFALRYVLSDMQEEVLALDPDYAGDIEIGAQRIDRDPLVFEWEGMNWTAAIVSGRLLWVGVAAILAAFAAVPFDRFDPARMRPGRQRGRRADPKTAGQDQGEAVAAPGLHSRSATLTPLTWRHFRPRPWPIVAAELRLALKGNAWWWFAVVAGLNIAGIAVSDPVARRYLHAVAWLWPLLVWSAMGNREQRFNTEQIIFSVPHPVSYQLLGVWLAGVGAAVLTGFGFVVRPLAGGEWSAVGAWLTGALFIPSLALALGTWSGNGRAFEVVHTLAWYLVALNGVAWLDYMGLTAAGAQAGIWVYYLVGAVGLLGLTVLGRWRRVRS